MSAHLLRYRTLTHTNVGWCRADVFRRPAGEGARQSIERASSSLGPTVLGPTVLGPTVVLVTNVDGHLGPKVRPAARMVAAAVHRELILPGEGWQLVLVEFNGSFTLVEFEQAFDGWFGRPSYRPLGAAAAGSLTATAGVR